MANQNKAHTELVNKILLECSHGDTRLFKNQVGVLQDKNGQFVRYGVCNPGGSDTIGWTKTLITPEMVGQFIAVFTAVEVKTGSATASDDQERFIAAIVESGGKAGVARSVEDARAITTLPAVPSKP